MSSDALLAEKAKYSLGYQISHDVFDVPNINNAGDPYARSFYQMNSHAEEKEVIARFAQNVLRMQNPQERVWGYCASGSTEALLNGLWMARKRFPQGTPVYASAECHFCVPKAADMLCMPFVSVETNPDGTMNMTRLRQCIHENAADAAIVVLTMGTTIRNAYDNLDAFYDVVVGTLPDPIHVHVDAAFGGAIYPFEQPSWLRHPFDTFNVSFHKFWGCPQPCSLFLVTKAIQQEVQGKGCLGKEMVCLPNKDFTIACSRNGTAVVMVHNLLRNEAGFMEAHKTRLRRCFAMKQYFIDAFPKSCTIHMRSAGAMSLSVELQGVPMSMEPTLREKYGMSVRNVTPTGTFDTHVYFCGHVSKSLLDTFFHDISKMETK